jgi:hypothetical protein
MCCRFSPEEIEKIFLPDAENERKYNVKLLDS